MQDFILSFYDRMIRPRIKITFVSVSLGPRNNFWKVNFKVLDHLSEIIAKLQRNIQTVNQKSEKETSCKDYKGRKKQMAWRVDYNTSSLPRQRRNWYQMLLRALSLPCARPAVPWRGPMQHYVSSWDKCEAPGEKDSFSKEICRANYYFIWMMIRWPTHHKFAAFFHYLQKIILQLSYFVI